MTPTADLAERPLDRILFSSALVEIGKFRVRPEDPRFQDSGPIERHIVVFPRNPVWIRHEGHKAFLAAPDLVTPNLAEAEGALGRRFCPPRSPRKIPPLPNAPGGRSVFREARAIPARI